MSTFTPPLPRPSRSTAYVLGLLLCVYVLNFLDRQVLNILAEPIRRDLGLSDTQIGILGGLAFGLLYTLAGIPIARYADRTTSNRPRIIGVALLVWSSMTCLSGLGRSFTHLLLARVGVGLGEAGSVPASHSLIADVVPREKRASAMAVFGMGVPIGALLGLSLGGVIADHFGWRMAFVIVGLPGVLLVPLIVFTLPEPRTLIAKDVAEKIDDMPSKGPSAMECAREIFTSPGLLWLLAAASLLSFLSYGKAIWTAVYLIRIHHLSPGVAGLWLGVLSGTAGVIGTWVGGWLADRYGSRNPRHYLTAPAVGMAVTAPLIYLGYMASDWRVSLALLWLPYMVNCFYYGPTFATAQMLVTPRVRAVVSSVLVFAMNLIGLGLGPLAFGWLSDVLRPALGADGLRVVLACSGFVGVISSFCFWRASLRLKTGMRS